MNNITAEIRTPQSDLDQTIASLSTLVQSSRVGKQLNININVFYKPIFNINHKEEPFRADRPTKYQIY